MQAKCKCPECGETTTCERVHNGLGYVWHAVHCGWGHEVEPLCPKCVGVPEQPEEAECRGCMECDFTGTREGYDLMQSLEKQSRETPRPELPDEG